MPELDELISAAADLEGATPDEVRGANRRRHISRSRQAAMWLAFKLTSNSLPQLGRAFQRHHTTVLYGIRAYERHLANDPQAKARSNELLTRLLTEAVMAKVARQPTPYQGGHHTMSRYRTPLGRLAVSAMNEEDLVALRRRVWRETGVAVIRPDDLTDDEARDAIVRTANRLFGPRVLRVAKEEI